MIFYKTSSFGNDFIAVDLEELPGGMAKGDLASAMPHRPRGGLACPQDRHSLGGLAREICDRQHGVGADGVVYYRACRKAAVPLGDRACRQAARPGESHLKRVSFSPGARKQQIEFQIYNRDGGAAELSGNGMACLAAVLLQRRLAVSPLVLQAGGGSRRVVLLERRGPVFRLDVEIGKPDFAARSFFPFLDGRRGPYDAAGMEFYPVSVGNPHAVVVCRKLPAAARLAGLGKKLEGHPLFPKRVNVEFVQALDAESCRVYFYERGVGPTLASSTGSAAVFAVMRRLGSAGESLEIEHEDDPIKVSWRDGIHIRIVTRLVCRGEYFL